jgi:hypothetical protein
MLSVTYTYVCGKNLLKFVTHICENTSYTSCIYFEPIFLFPLSRVRNLFTEEQYNPQLTCISEL